MGKPRLLATLTDDVQAVSEAVRLIPFLCIDLAMVAGCLVYIIWLSWPVFLMVCVLMTLALGSCRNLIQRGRDRLTFAREEQDDLFQHIRASTEGTKELKLHYQRRQAFLSEDLEATAHRFHRYNTTGFTFFAVTASWGKLIFFFTLGFVLFALPQLLTLDPKTLSSYILVFTYLMVPMERVVNGLPVLSRAGVSMKKIESLGLALESRAEHILPPATQVQTWQQLQIKGVTHTYQGNQEDRNFTLGPIELTLKPGELVFIVGGNGSGKSTLAKLITGLYIPDSGEISVDGQLITNQNREWYRQHFAVVFADFYLFERLLGLDQDGLDQQASDFLEKLQLDHKVTVNQGRFSTTELSTGQRKRLTLLSACLEDRPVYLFDEWAADQDPTFKDLFYTQFIQQLRDQGKAVLVISHDDHYFHLADRIIKLDYGKIEYDKHPATANHAPVLPSSST